MYDYREIRKKAEKDFKQAWLESGVETKGRKFELKGRGKPHIINEYSYCIRKILLKLGFDEVITPMIWEEGEVYNQYGPEAPIILDRCYYLAGLPRADIGISKKDIEKIEKIGKIDIEKLKDILRRYKSGAIEADDLTEVMVEELNIKTEQTIELLELFKEFTNLKPVPTNLTLLSHFTTAWFPILSAMKEKRNLPVKLFTWGTRFRREQREDSTHLRAHQNASVVVMAEEFTLEDGKEIARRIFDELGFEKLDFRVKKATANYYAPKSEIEVFAKMDGNWIEIADLGMYSPVALANYKIPYPVFNLGFSVSRLAMVQKKYSDIRKMTHPELYAELELSDKEIASLIDYDLKPSTETGREIQKKIVRVSLKNKDAKAPCEFVAWEGKMKNKKIKVIVFEVEKDKKLLGPAAINKIFVEDGNIVAFTKSNGLDTKKTLIEALAAEVAHYAEKAEEKTVRSGMVKQASDINIYIPQNVRRFITNNNKKLEIKGPVFTAIRIETERLKFK